MHLSVQNPDSQLHQAVTPICMDYMNETAPHRGPVKGSRNSGAEAVLLPHLDTEPNNLSLGQQSGVAETFVLAMFKALELKLLSEWYSEILPVQELVQVFVHDLQKVLLPDTSSCHPQIEAGNVQDVVVTKVACHLKELFEVHNRLHIRMVLS